MCLFLFFCFDYFFFGSEIKLVVFDTLQTWLVIALSIDTHQRIKLSRLTAQHFENNMDNKWRHHNNKYILIYYYYYLNESCLLYFILSLYWNVLCCFTYYYFIDLCICIFKPDVQLLVEWDKSNRSITLRNIGLDIQDISVGMVSVHKRNSITTNQFLFKSPFCDRQCF